PSVSATFLFAVSLLAALLTGFGIRVLVSMSAFWLIDTRGTRQMVDSAIDFGGGVVAAQTLFPDWLRFGKYLPFAGLNQTPAQMFRGTLHGVDALVRVAVQLAWVAALLAAGRYVTTLATRRVVIQGG